MGNQNNYRWGWASAFYTSNNRSGSEKQQSESDDLAMYRLDRFQVKQALARPTNLELTVNLTETEAMKLQERQRWLVLCALSAKASFGVWSCFFLWRAQVSLDTSPNDAKRRALAVQATERPHSLLLTTPIAANLLDLKVAPITTYALRVTWEDPTVENVEQLNDTKPSSFRRTRTEAI